MTGAAPTALGAVLREAGLSLGLARVGFTSAAPFERGATALRRWLDRGFAGDMAYMRDSLEDRTDPRRLLPGARSIIVGALALPPRPAPPSGVAAVARYALGGDYHTVLHNLLRALAHKLSSLAGAPVTSLVCVDTWPLLEREAAERAGVAFIGKSTMAIVPGLGSHVMLGAILTDLALTPDLPATPRCGTCTACLDACPTRALVEPYVVDSRRCVSYLTIETRDAMPPELRPLVGPRVFGCDACQDACPFNATRHRAAAVPELAPRPALAAPDLASWLTLGNRECKRLVRGTVLLHSSRHHLARNAAVALGNSGDSGVVGPLTQAAATHPNELVRVHAAWALARLGGGTPA